MSRASWARSGRRQAPAASGPTAEGWELSLVRARQAWDGLTGGGPYSDAAAAAILELAVALWRDSSAMLGEPDGPDREDPVGPV